MGKKIDTAKTEKKALNVLEAIIDKSPNMDHKFNSDDKELGWDGYIYLYKDKTKSLEKENFDTRIPVQIKGRSDKNKKYINKPTISYSVEINDLKLYSHEKGVMYFIIFFDSDDNYEIFYKSLYPSMVLSYLNNCVNNKTKKNIKFSKLAKEPDILFRTVRQFALEADKQGSTQNPLVKDMIKSNEINTLTNITFNFINYNFKLSRLIVSGDICLYGKDNNDKYLRPIEWSENLKVTVNTNLENKVSINEEVFYNRFEYMEDSTNKWGLKLSPNLYFDLENKKIIFDVISDIKTAYNDARFLLLLRIAGAFSIGPCKITFSIFSISDHFVDLLTNITKIYDILTAIDFGLDIKIKECTHIQLKQLSELLEFSSGEKNNLLKHEVSKYIWKYGGSIVPIFIEKKDNDIILVNAVYQETKIVTIKFEGSNRVYRIPFITTLYEFELLHLYLFDFEKLISQINKSDIDEVSADLFLNFALRIINVFDRKKDSAFLDYAQYILIKVKPYIDSSIYLLNLMQIKIRTTCLEEDDVKTINEISTNDNCILFGKNVLLGNKRLAEQYFDLFSESEKKDYMQLPIYHLYQGL